MSSESKKRRGEAGVTKAKNSPFRLNGLPPDWQARRVGAFHGGGARSSGSTTMRGILGGILAKSLGYEMYGASEIFDHLISHAEKRCTHPLLRDDQPAESVQLLEAA